MRGWMDLFLREILKYAAGNNFIWDGRTCATRNALVLLETILYKFGRIYATGNDLMMLETILCKFWQICVTENALMLLERILCEFGLNCATGSAFGRLLAGTPFWKFLPKFEQECAEPFYVLMTHHTAKANLEKGSFWPSEAIPYGLHLRVDF